MSQTGSAAQAWALDDGGLLGSSPLPSTSGLGVFAGAGDFDGDGREDIAWSDASDANRDAVAQDRQLAGPRWRWIARWPAYGSVVSGNTMSDDTMFRTRFCSGRPERQRQPLRRPITTASGVAWTSRGARPVRATWPT
jgi:hypothetical protein